MSYAMRYTTNRADRASTHDGGMPYAVGDERGSTSPFNGAPPHIARLGVRLYEVARDKAAEWITSRYLGTWGYSQCYIYEPDAPSAIAARSRVEVAS